MSSITDAAHFLPIKLPKTKKELTQKLKGHRRLERYFKELREVEYDE